MFKVLSGILHNKIIRCDQARAACCQLMLHIIARCTPSFRKSIMTTVRTKLAVTRDRAHAACCQLMLLRAERSHFAKCMMTTIFLAGLVKTDCNGGGRRASWICYVLFFYVGSAALSIIIICYCHSLLITTYCTIPS